MSTLSINTQTMRGFSCGMAVGCAPMGMGSGMGSWFGEQHPLLSPSKSPCSDRPSAKAFAAFGHEQHPPSGGVGA